MSKWAKFLAGWKRRFRSEKWYVFFSMIIVLWITLGDRDGVALREKGVITFIIVFSLLTIVLSVVSSFFLNVGDMTTNALKRRLRPETKAWLEKPIDNLWLLLANAVLYFFAALCIRRFMDDDLLKIWGYRGFMFMGFLSLANSILLWILIELKTKSK